MTKEQFSEEKYNSLDDVNITIPLFLFLLKMDPEISGRIYSVLRAKKNLLLEKQFNNNFILWDKLNIDEHQEGKHICHGENNNQHEYIKYTSETIKGGIIKYVRPDINPEYKINYYFNKILDEINPATKMIYLVHPTYILSDTFEKSEFENFINKVPKNIAIVLDECYIEYLDKDIINSLHYIKNHFIFGLRTFSKLYGLASCRIGYIISNDKYKSILSSGFSLKSIPSHSIECAINVLINKENINETKVKIQKEKIYLEKELNKLKIRFMGKTIFILLFLQKDIDKLTEELKKNNILILNGIFKNTLIYQIGTHKFNKILINVLNRCI